MLKSFKLLAALAGALMLSGCADVARGVTEAVLEHNQASEDTRSCEIEGPAFEGVQQSLALQAQAPLKVTKVLMIHGINDHSPGYSDRFQKKLYAKLGLTVTDPQIKTLQLHRLRDFATGKQVSPQEEAESLGTLRITRHADPQQTRELIFYELTWSPITADQKKSLESDSANHQGLARATLNGSLKSFLNATVPDLLIYNGNGYNRITDSVAQSVCWMFGDEWKDLPLSAAQPCQTWPKSTFASLKNDDHFFVTHSLGSRITLDTVQNFSALNAQRRKDTQYRAIADAVRDKTFTVFMLANQLPLLQMGRNPPQVTNQAELYCEPGASKARERVIQKMNIVAFSDPNDILSYPVPADFTANEIDSRVCASVTNVSLNIAEEKNLFDAASFANPLTAHTGYMEDDRVIDLIANGMQHHAPAHLADERCSWLETARIEKGASATR